MLVTITSITLSYDQSTASIEIKASINNNKLDSARKSPIEYYTLVPKIRPLQDFSDPLIPIQAPPLPGTQKGA
jgi:hypothetical protein